MQSPVCLAVQGGAVGQQRVPFHVILPRHKSLQPILDELRAYLDLPTTALPGLNQEEAKRGEVN